MFNKQAKSSNAPSKGASAPTKGAPPAPIDTRKSAKVASVVADDMVIDGGITCEGEVHLDGTVRGDVRVGRLTVGETGLVEGSVYAETVECRGRVVGSVSGKLVRLFATAYIDGDITHEQLAMETGAFFQGRSLKFQRPALTNGMARPESSPGVVTLQPAPTSAAS